MAISKFTLKESGGGGGDHNSQIGEDLEVQVAKCSNETRLMFAASFETSGKTPLWTTWFLENHIKSQKTTYIWKK
jgi:hypothetical protein